MELFIGAAAAAGILALIAFLSPGVERQRRPVRSMIGRDQHERRMERASVAAQVAQRHAPRPLRISGDAIRPIEAPVHAAPAILAPATIRPAVAGYAPAPAGFLASAGEEDPSGPMLLPPPVAVAPRLDWARQASESLTRNQRERNADGLVASLLGPSARAS